MSLREQEGQDSQPEGARRVWPDARGHFGPYGGRYVPETLMEPLIELEAAFLEARSLSSFRQELAQLLRDYVGRPTPLTFAARLSGHLGCRLYLKREDLCHTGAHKINNALGQALLARRMGKTRVVAETGAGQHGVATATACALLGLDCVVYMGTEDMSRQAPNVRRMDLLGAEVRGVDSGSRTLKDAINEAMRDWVTHVRTTHYLLGSVLGAHPYPMMVRDFQSVIGDEARSQILGHAGRLPDVLVACVGGGSNALGLFYAFLEDPVELVGVEAGGRSSAPGDHASRLVEQGGAASHPPETPRALRRSDARASASPRPPAPSDGGVGPFASARSPLPESGAGAHSPEPTSGSGAAIGVLHGTCTYLLQNDAGNVLATHSIAAGLDYPAVGPEHALLRDEGRVRYTSVRDSEAVGAFRLLAEMEGILPALESSHAIAWVVRESASLKDRLVLLNLSGRGDKDLEILKGVS